MSGLIIRRLQVLTRHIVGVGGHLQRGDCSKKLSGVRQFGSILLQPKEVEGFLSTGRRVVVVDCSPKTNRAPSFIPGSVLLHEALPTHKGTLWEWKFGRAIHVQGQC